ncbi:MAG TPA: hypothetical protein VHV30_05485 [Polyangiaceae bacterium]|nr:hypothetical protein [Polyangiaceae bacterium]
MSWIFFVVAGILIVTARGASAADSKVEKEAQALQKKAIEEDNLNVNYAGAVKKLQTAIAKCDGDKCSSNVKATLLRDLGAMQVLNGAVDEGKASFGQALGMDSSIDLDPAYKNPQLEGIWAEVKKKGGGAAAAPVKAGPQPTGDFSCTPPTEALVRTPLPIYVEYTGSEELARVTVKYKGFGQGDWKTIELKKSGDSGYGALIPCKDATQGLMSFYVQGFNGQNDPVANSGTRSKPFTVPVNTQITGPNPSLPGEEPPEQCQDTGECPPGFPGCGSKKKASGEECAKDDDCDSNSCVDEKCADKKSTGDDCTKDEECSSGSCSSGKCAGKKAEGDDCESDEDCDSNRCKENKCTAGAGNKSPKVWLGISVQADWYALPGQNDACFVSSASPYACVDPSSGSAFPQSGLRSQTVNGMNFPTLSPLALNQDIAQGIGDQVVGGFKLSNFRVMLSLDYALGKNVLLGLRGGYVFNTDPSSSAFAPIHLEGRLTYLFGKDAVSKKGITPMLFAGVGAGEFDAFVPVDVTLRDGRGPATENAWLTAGPGFFSVGGGARLLLSTKVAAMAALTFEGGFGGAAGFLPGVAPELGIQFGL